jgi:hypothetical protein
MLKKESESCRWWYQKIPRIAQLFQTNFMTSFFDSEMLDPWKIVLWSLILDFDVQQVYLVEYLLILKIKEDMMHFLFFIVGGKSDQFYKIHCMMQVSLEVFCTFAAGCLRTSTYIKLHTYTHFFTFYCKQQHYISKHCKFKKLKHVPIKHLQFTLLPMHIIKDTPNRLTPLHLHSSNHVDMPNLYCFHLCISDRKMLKSI